MKSEELAALLNKQFGKETVVTSAIQDVDVIPTGCIPLDIALGVGGIPVGRMTEIYGNEGSGKSTIALQTIASAQRMGKNAVYIDAENAIDVRYAEHLGVDLSSLILIQPNTAEKTLEIILKIFSEYDDDLGVVVLDSVAALTTTSEADSEIGDANVGTMARILSSFIRRMTPVLNKSKAAFLVINQVRANISGARGFGAPNKTTPGGYALRHACSVRVEFARIGNVTTKGNVTAIKVKADIKKNKVAPPYRRAEYEIELGLGTQVQNQIIDLAVDAKLIKRAGSWYKYGEESLGQNAAAVLEYLNQQELTDTICKQALDNTDLPEAVKEFYVQYFKDIGESNGHGEDSDGGEE